MATDPFANADTDSTTTTTDQKESTTVENTPNNNNNKIVVTLKGGSGYDAPWVVVHADTPDEAMSILHPEEIKPLLEAAQEAGKFFASKGSPAKSGGGKPAAASQAPGGQEAPEGYVFKSGMGKTGKPWKAYMPIDRNSGLDPIWL